MLIGHRCRATVPGPHGHSTHPSQFRFRLQLQPAQLNQREQHDSPCCVLETSAIRRNQWVQNRLPFSAVQPGLIDPARLTSGKPIPRHWRVNRENRPAALRTRIDRRGIGRQPHELTQLERQRCRVRGINALRSKNKIESPIKSFGSY